MDDGVMASPEKYLIHSVEMVQRRAAQYLAHCFSAKSLSNMLKMLKWETLEQRRRKAHITMGYRIMHGLVAIPKDQLIYAAKSTRGHDQKYNKMYVRTSYYKYTFLSFVPMWNRLLSTSIESTSVDVTRNKLANIYIFTILSNGSLTGLSYLCCFMQGNSSAYFFAYIVLVIHFSMIPRIHSAMKDVLVNYCAMIYKLSDIGVCGCALCHNT